LLTLLAGLTLLALLARCIALPVVLWLVFVVLIHMTLQMFQI
jgi:hypothetical protein